MQNNTPSHITITAEESGQRVDKALHRLFPHLSVRGRKALWQNAIISLNGRKANAGQMVCEGDVLQVQMHNEVAQKNAPSLMQHKAKCARADEVRFLDEKESWLFFHKPCGLPTVHVSQGAYSLQDYLQEQEDHYGALHLCNRLDTQTSGIVVAARNIEGVTRWQKMEDAKQCEKRYVALVNKPYGQDLQQATIVRAALDTHKRKITRVLEAEADPLRKTLFMPLGAVEAEDYTGLREYFSIFPEIQNTSLSFMGCIIHKGARHQIRAHAAHAGFSLFHDIRYIQRQVPEEESFVLHHGALHFRGHSVSCPPPWQAALGHMLRLQLTNFLAGG